MQFTRRERDCLEQVRKEGGITLVRLSKGLRIKPSTAHALVLRLVRKGAMSKDRNNVLRLTPTGERSVERIIFRHRVLEILLANNGVSADEACAECKKMDFLMSDKVANELFERLRRPKVCPHGNPIRIAPKSGKGA